MPSGSSKTGRQMPKTPGSKRSGQDIALIGRSSRNNVPPSIIWRIRSHRTAHQKMLAAKPKIHTQKRTSGIRLGLGIGTVAAGTTGKSDATKGWLISSITIAIGVDAFAAAVRH